jgi:peroxiredoxin
MVMRLANALAESPAESPRSSEERRSLFLRDGDVIPSAITRIDEDGVYFKSSLSENKFVPHAKVQAVELVPDDPEANTVHLVKSKRERMLMLPRMQKADPPTHLIRSKNGDYLRGRVLKMDDRVLTVEVRLETKEIPRDRVSRIIWFHPDELDESKSDAKPRASGSGARVQALRNDGVRITFVAEKFAAGSLVGKSDVLGACQVAVTQIDQLLIGRAIEQAAAQLVYHQWKLKNAPEPKFVTADEGGEGGGENGTESPLVGKPAPDFELDIVGGKKFHLADSKGKEVVVLDFWATWCGPCLQAMPQVERAAGEFKDKGVRLVAVNLQETADQVTALLERQKLHVTVALDRDGSVANKYQAVAIPQTVIVNRDGTVARLFVGGGGRLEQTLKDALKAVVEGEKPKEPAK